MHKCRDLLTRVAVSPREEEDSKLGQQSILPCSDFCLHVQAWSSRSHSPRRGMAYGGDTVLAVVPLWEWWLFTNSPTWHGLVVVIVASVLTPISLGRSCDAAIQGSGHPSWATCSLGHGLVPLTSHGPGRGIGCGHFERSWLLIMILIL